jgi:hypothetical protein
LGFHKHFAYLEDAVKKRILLVAALAVVFLGIAGAERGQSPPDFPSLPSDFTAQLTLTTPFPLTVMRATIYEDYTHRRQRIDISSPKGGLATSVFVFFDKHESYSVVYSAENAVLSCVKGRAGGLKGMPLALDFPDAVLKNEFTIDGQVIQLWVDEVAPEEVTEIYYNTSTEALVSLVWWSRFGEVHGHIKSFESGEPSAATYNLPAICVE